MHAFPALERDEKPLDVLFPTMQRLELNLLRKDKHEDLDENDKARTDGTDPDDCIVA